MGWVLLEKDPPSRREQFVLVADADTVMEAELLASELQQAGIHAISLSAGNVYMAERGMVWVPATERHEALRLLKEMHSESEREHD